MCKKLCGFITGVAISCEILAMGSVRDRLDQLEEQMNQVLVQNSAGTFGAQYGDRDNMDLGHGWSIDLEALLWHVKSGGVDWALVLDQGYYPISGSMKNLDFGWDWGLRVGITKYCHNDWDIDLLYTYFRSADSAKTSADFVTPSNIGVTGNSSASYSGKVTYNALDLILGKSMFVSSRLSSRPHIGLKNVWITQKYTLNDLNYINLGSLSGNVNMNVIDRDKVWGIGPEAGWDFNWYIVKCFSLIGTFEGALLQGYFRASEHEVLDTIPVGATATETTTKLAGNMHQFIPHARMLLGLNWGRLFNQGNQRIDVSVNYELNYFWRINQMLNQATSTTSATGSSTRILVNRWSEDLAFYGVTFRVNVGF